MAALTDPWNLDPTSGQNASNSNYAGANIQEQCQPSGLNNALRALGSMLAQGISYKSASISASVSTMVAATGTGLYQSVLGVGPVNSFGLVSGQQAGAAVVRLLHFASSCSVSHGASIILLGAASRRTQPGDISGIIHDHATDDVWREWLFSRADGSLVAGSISATTITAGSISASAVSTVTLNAASASVTNIVLTSVTSISASVGSFGRLNIGAASSVGLVIQTAFTMSQTAGSTASNIPSDTTAPLFNEGGQAFSVAFTPKVATSTVLIEASVTGGQATTGNDYTISLFKNGTGSNACVACVTQECASNGALSAHLAFSEAAGSTTLRSYQLRYGASSGTAVINDTAAGDTMGGKFVSSLKITEFL
jgi:hypothetical protein